MELTVDMAYAAGEDAANRQMRSAGRKAWNADDYNLACKVTNELMDKMEPIANPHD